jgi:hypothetical protein
MLLKKFMYRHAITIIVEKPCRQVRSSGVEDVSTRITAANRVSGMTGGEENTKHTVPEFKNVLLCLSER